MTYSSTCRHCGEKHGMICPWVKAIEFYPMDNYLKGGTIKRVEFWSRAELDAMAIKANPSTLVGVSVNSDPLTVGTGMAPIGTEMAPIGTSTGSVGGTAVGTLFNPQGHTPTILCGRCGKEGHHTFVCPETLADNRKVPGYYR